jgi:carboxypeptidase D
MLTECSTASNLLVIDHPAQVGFSYSKAVPGYYNNNAQLVQLADEICPNKGIPGSCGTFSADNTTANEVNSTASAAPSMWKTLQGFMGAFPQYSRGDFIFATESYGGHYGPIFNQYLQSQNALIDCGELPGAHHIDLRALLIGNGWYDPLIQYAAYYNFSVYPGNTYDLSPYNKTIQDQVYNAMYGPGQCYDQTLACHTGGSNSVCIAADILCASEVEFALDQYAQRDEYDIRELQPDPFPYGFFQDYLNTEVVQKAVGAFTNYSASSSTVGIDFGKTGDDNREAGTVEAVRELLAQGIYVIMYAGDADYNCNWVS